MAPNRQAYGGSHVRFMVMTRADAGSEAGEMPSPEVMEKMGAVMEEATRSGVLQGGEGLFPSGQGVRLKLAGGKLTRTDGPFPDTITNYAILNVASLDEAVAWSTRWAEVFGELECEIRQIVEMEDLPPEYRNP
jgi:hypothetical protein